MRLFVKQNTFVNCVYVHTQMCVCVCVCIEGYYPCVYFHRPHTAFAFGVCLLHSPSLPCPLPKPVCKDTGHNVDVCANVCVCVCLLFCSLFCDNRMLSPRLPPLPHCNPLGDIKGKPEKGYLEKRVAKQPNTHHPEHHQPKTPFQACNQISILMRL